MIRIEAKYDNIKASKKKNHSVERERDFDSIKGEHLVNNELMNTIQMPKNMKNLTKRLPKANYDNNPLINRKRDVEHQSRLDQSKLSKQGKDRAASQDSLPYLKSQYSQANLRP